MHAYAVTRSVTGDNSSFSNALKVSLALTKESGRIIYYFTSRVYILSVQLALYIYSVLSTGKACTRRRSNLYIPPL